MVAVDWTFDVSNRALVRSGPFSVGVTAVGSVVISGTVKVGKRISVAVIVPISLRSRL